MKSKIDTTNQNKDGQRAHVTESPHGRISRASIIFREMVNMALIPLGFGAGHALLPPTVASIFLTKRCNSRCSICDYWKVNDFSDELSTVEWKAVLRDLRYLGVKIINFTADGEIFARNDACEILKFAGSLGLVLTINTNGLVLDRRVKNIVDLDPLQVQVSLDAFSDSLYEKIRGIPNGFISVRKNIIALRDAGYKKISVGSVLTRDNLDDLIKLQRFCLDEGFVFRVTAFQFHGFGAKNSSITEEYREEAFLAKLKKTVNKLADLPINNTRYYLESMIHYYTRDKFHPLNCVVGQYRVFILPNGDVCLCNIMHERAVAGNVRVNSLKNIWYGRRADYIRKGIKAKRCPSCWLSCFAEENIRFSPRGFAENIVYFLKKSTRLYK